MLFTHSLLVFFGLFCYQSAHGESLALPDKSASNCFEKCNSNFKAACERGCAFAYALTTAPKAYPFNPSCAESCKDFYSTSTDEVNTCIFGCDSYTVSVEKPQSSWFTSILNFYRRFMSRIGYLNGKPTLSQTTASDNQQLAKPDEQSIVTRIRIFYFARPDEAEDASRDLQPLINDKPTSAHSEFQQGNKNELMKIDKEQRKVVDNSIIVSRTWQFTCLLRNIFSDPIKLLFLVTMITLLVLLVAQLALCIRRQRRSVHYGYIPLPTYSEAVDIKLPTETNKEAYEGFTKGMKGSDA